MVEEILTPPEQVSTPQVFSGVRVARSLVFWVMFCRPLFVFLAISLSVLVRFTVSDYPRDGSRGGGGAHSARAPLKIEKNMIFLA